MITRTWLGLFAPAGTPRPIIDKPNKAIGFALKQPHVIEKLKLQGITTASSTPEEPGAIAAAELDMWGEGAAVDRHRSGVSGSSNLGGGAGRPACDAFFLSERRNPISLAARYAIPAVYFFREFVMEGGLMRYSPSLVQAYRQVGICAGRILNGAKPADSPVSSPRGLSS